MKHVQVYHQKFPKMVIKNWESEEVNVYIRRYELIYSTNPLLL